MNKPNSPGPWFFVEPSKLHGRQYKDWIITYGDGHNWVCLGPEWDASFQEESDANGRLISAAPELLEVLEELMVGGYLPTPGFEDKYSEGLGAKARAAIAKARRE